MTPGPSPTASGPIAGLVALLPRLVGGAATLVAGCTFLYPISEKVDSDAGTETIADGAGPDAVGEEKVPECTSDQQCQKAHGDTPFACRLSDHRCQPLQTAECRVVYPRTWVDPRAVFLGAYTFLPESGPEDSDLVWDYELAVQEFNDQGGLPDTGGASHTLVTIICNNDPEMAANDPNFLFRSLDHLTDVVGVSAIVADLPPKDLIHAFERTKQKAKDVFLLSPGPATRDLAALDDNDRVWSMLGLPSDLAPAYTALLGRVAAYIRSVDPAVGAVRVALVKSNDEGEPRHEQLAELIDALTRMTPGDPDPHRLEFNGQDLEANELAGNYREFTLEATPESPSVVGQQVLAFAPHVVISMAGPAFTHFDSVATYDGVADTIESRSTDRRYPFFILSPVNASASDDITTTIRSIAQGYPEIHRRFLGLDVASADDPTLYYEYLDRLRTAHPLARGRTENYYDPIYSMAYAMYRAGVDRLQGGNNILAGMIATLAGDRYDVGPRPIPMVFSALQPGPSPVSIELIGTMGEPNFNQRTGIRVNRAALYCFPPPPRFEVHQQAQVFVGGSWQGEFDCYPGF